MFRACCLGLALLLAPGPAVAGSLDTLLDSTFRIDIESITATLDWYPTAGQVDGTATLVFRMRPGQTRAVFNFAPFIAARSTVSRLVLDGRSFGTQSDTDVRIISAARTHQQFVEIQFALAAETTHVLTIDYRLTVPSVYPRFSSEVNDILGRGNETIWPTLNTPHELARHVLTFRVHDNRAFRFVGSGRTTATQQDGVQQWVLDTGRAVSSYSVMFVLLPVSDTEYQEWVIDGVPVRALAFTGVNVAEAKNRLEAWLPELRQRFGPFPASHGLSLFLYSNAGGGMEYYGGTITSLSALRHEVLHSYFGCSVVLRTYPDTWLDEAITQWFEQITRGVTTQPLPETYRGNWVGARSPVSIGFSTRAYSDGASIMQYIANRLGGTDRMTDFLRTVVQNRTFAPFTTLEFSGDLAAFSGIDLRSQFLNWLYDAREPALFQ
ncbi:MAG TPA: hypothetical protein VF147_10280, partial [Vicinamibacterales bacterium]